MNHPDAPGAPPLTVTRGFDDAGDLVRLTYPGGREVVFERDAIGRTVTVDNVTRGVGYPGRVATPDAHPIARIAWAGRRLWTTRYPGGTETELAADAAARVTAIGHTVGGANALRQSHLFDGVGNLRVRQEADGGHGDCPALQLRFAVPPGQQRGGGSRRHRHWRLHTSCNSCGTDCRRSARDGRLGRTDGDAAVARLRVRRVGEPHARAESG